MVGVSKKKIGGATYNSKQSFLCAILTTKAFLGRRKVYKGWFRENKIVSLKEKYFILNLKHSKMHKIFLQNPTFQDILFCEKIAFLHWSGGQTPFNSLLRRLLRIQDFFISSLKHSLHHNF